jgi:hypothetical protein
MLICVDGTGPSDDDEYLAAMVHGFVRQISQRSLLPKVTTKYYRGPEPKGITKLVTPATVVMHSIVPYLQGGDRQIFMIGYSRGGGVVIEAASILNALNPDIKVEALFLFDAVSRDLLLNAEVIPANVNHCIFARRDRLTESRRSFGNCGLQLANGGRPLIRDFFTTHGGMGGTPWGNTGVPGMTQALSKTNPATQALLTRNRDSMFIVEDFVDSLGIDMDGSIDRHGHATKVTIAQEIKGMQEVKDWMWYLLRKHLVMPWG